MPADDGEHVMLMALAVGDQASYARYREEMTPLLVEHGGRFLHDFVVAAVLRGASEAVNRVFTIGFPDREARERFFFDPRYVAVRARWFEPAVQSVETLGRLTETSR